MPKKNTISGKFAKDIKGFENQFISLKNLFVKNNWSLSSVRNTMKRFVEGWNYDNIKPDDIDLNTFSDNIMFIRQNRFDRQSKSYFIAQYGVNLGEIKFKDLQKIQSYTNSKEYKGMTDGEFADYNKSRAITLDNMIKRYGYVEGTLKFNDYCSKQRYTKSKQRYIDEGRLDDYYEINKRKAITLNNMIKRYGEEVGTKKFNDFVQKCNKFYSKIASDFFTKLDEGIKEFELTTKYEPKTCEFWLVNNNNLYYYDFLIEELNYIIEFNGDTFHANPKLFKSDDHPNPFVKNLTAKEIWINDQKKNSIAKDVGYDIDSIWEFDYNKNKNYYINYYINKIKEKLGSVQWN